MSLPVVLYLLAAVLVLAGLAGTLLPVLPGAPLVFAGLLLAAWADGFQHVGPWPLLALGGLALIAAPGSAGWGPLALMAAAGVGWGLYSLAGRGAADPLAASAWNFLLSVPLVLPLGFAA
ncbi:MAG: hypothetical protein ACK4MU_02380, partial [Thermomonas sp.]